MIEQFSFLQLITSKIDDLTFVPKDYYKNYWTVECYETNCNCVVDFWMN